MDEKRMIQPLNIRNFWKQIEYYKKNNNESPSNLNIAPHFAKILKRANTSVEDLEPLTFEEFLEINDLTLNSDDYTDGNDYYDRYQIEISRRKRQIEILKQMDQSHSQNEHKKQPSSSRKSSRAKVENSRMTKTSKANFNSEKSQKNLRDFIKFSSLSEYELHRKRSRNEDFIQRKTSVFSCLSRSASKKSKNKKRIQQIKIFEQYTQGKPYIEEYYNQLHIKVKNDDQGRIKTSPNKQYSKRSSRVNKIGKISKQKLSGASLEENQKESSISDTNKKQRHYKYTQNQYDIPVPKSKFGAKQNLEKQKQKRICKQLIVEVKKFQQKNKKYKKDMKSLQKSDKVSRQKLLGMSSRQKFQDKKNIDKLKDRIISKQSRK